MKKILGMLLKALAAVLALVVLAAVGVIVVNFKDQAIKPEAEALLRSEPIHVAAAENGFAVFAGLSAPPGQDARDWGGRWVAAAGAVQDAAGAERFAAQWKGAPPKPGEKPFCNPLEQACLARAAEVKADTAALLDANRELLERYDALAGLPAFEETYTPSAAETPMPNLQAFVSAQALAYARAGLKLADGDANAALDDIERDIALQRRLLAGARWLILKLSAASALARSELVLSEYMRLVRTADPERLRRIAAALTPAERSLERALAAEFRAMAAGLANTDRVIATYFPGAMPPLGLLYQPGATVNLYHDLFVRVRQMAAGAPADVDAGRAAIQAAVEAGQDWSFLYNFTGKQLLRQQFPNYPEPVYRMHDLDGITRLVALQAAAYGRELDEEQIAGFAAAQDKALADPYAGKPMNWDAKAKQWWFAPRSDFWRSRKLGGQASRIAISP